VAAGSTIQALKERLNCVNLAHARADRTLSTGWRPVDAALGGGLLAGALHEWFGACAHANPPGRRGLWSPPLCILVHLAWRAFAAHSPPRWAIWIGQQCFPYPGVLVRDAGTDQRLLEHSLWVAAPTADSRLWAIDLALRSSAVGVVIADGSAFSMAASRRIQLLAEKHQTFACLARPPWEQDALSCAQTRWLVRWAPHVSPSAGVVFKPRWNVELLRCKGVQIANHHGPWILEWDSDTCTLDLSSEMAHSARDPQEQPAHTRPNRTARSA